MKDNRKEFIKKSVALAAMSVGGIAPALSESLYPETKEQYESGFADAFKESTIRIAIQAPVDPTTNELSFYKQMGMKHVVLWTDETKAGASYYSEKKKLFADAGLEVYGFGNRSVHNEEKIVLNLPGREEKIEQYKQHLRDLGKAGITYTTYAHMGNGIWSSERETTRAGASARALDLNGAHWGEWNGKKYYPPLSHGRVYTVNEMWANFKYFIQAVAPVAEQNNVRIGIHPDDPTGLPSIAGVPRLFSHLEGYNRALDLAKSSNVGLCLCVGSWMEGGSRTGKDCFGMIDYFGKQKKIFKIHFRNVDKPLPHFTETFVDNGYTDMYKVMKALKKVDFDGVLIADHIPRMIAPAPRNSNNASAPTTAPVVTASTAAPTNYRGLAFSIGYIKSLRDRVEDEAGNYQNAPV